MQAHLAKSGSHVHFLRDIDLIWERAREIKIDDKIDLTDLLEVQWRCALSRSSVTALASNFPPLLPALLARDGVADWGISQAHAYANAIPDPVQRAKAKLAFLDLEDIDIRPSQRTQITSEVLSALRSSKGTDRTKGRLLISLLKSCKSLTASQTETALEVIDGFAKPLWRAKGLAQLISDIDDEEVQLKALANIIRSCRETGGAFEAFHHLPYLYAEIANNLPLNLLGQATTEAFDNSEMWYGRKHEFFAELAWHIVPQQAEEFMKVTHMQCPSHFSLTGVAIVLSRVSSKLSDEVALKLAEELARQYRAGDSLDRTFYRTFWYTGGGCIPAFLILAYHRAELKNRRRLLNLSRELINEFGEDEHSMTQDDLWTLYRIIEGSCSDEEAAQLVIKEGFLKGFFIGGQKFGLFSEEIVDCLGPETLKAILKPVTRPPDDWHFCIGKSGYFLPKIASKLSDQEWPLVYRIGPGRGEYATLGYIRATTQNITREGTPEELRKELIKWALGGWYDRSPESRQEMLLSVASYVVPGDILDDDGYSTGLRTIELMAPNLSTEVKRAVLSVSIPVSYTSEKSERRALEFTTNIVRYLRTRRERAKWLQSLLQKQSKITDLDQQIQFLTALIGLSDRPCRRSIRKLGTQIQSRKKLQQRELKRREWLHWSNSLKKNEDNSAPSLISKCLSFLANSTTIWRYVWPISSFLMEIFNDFTNLDWQRIFFLISRYRPISCYLKTMLGDFGSQDWGHSLAGEQSLNDGLKQITETGIRVHPDVSLSEADLTHLRIQVRALCELKDSRKRQSALLEIARIIDGLRIAYPFNVFGVYIKRCEDIWRDLDPAFAVDALHVLQNPNMFREINVPYPYRILIPVILTKRPSLLPEVLKALDKYPWREDKGITYAEAAYFSKGEEQLSILKKAVEAADRDVDRNESRLWTLNAIATYAPNSITENLLSWIEKRPYVSPLIKLAPNIASVPRYRNKALDIACRMSRKRPVHKLICAMAPYLDGDGIVKSVQMIVDRGIPIDGYITQDSKSEEDDPVLSYYCLVQCLLELPKNIIYETWSRSLKIISTQSREDLLLHAIWWLPVIIKLGGQEVLISTAQAVSELGDWQWYSLET
jgi:hypothetical protein